MNTNHLSIGNTGGNTGGAGRSGLRAMILLGVAAALMAGCSTVTTMKRQTDRVARAIVGDGMTRRVAVATFDDGGFSGEREFGFPLARRFADSLKDAAPEVSWWFTEAPDYPSELKSPPRRASGEIDNVALAALGRKHGMNAVLLVRINLLDSEERVSGFWPFRGTKYVGRIQLHVICYNTGTGAKLIDEVLSRETEIDGIAHDAIRAGDRQGLTDMAEPFEDLCADAAERLRRVVGGQVWETWLSSVRGDVGEAMAGSVAGLSAGKKLAVFRIGATMTGEGGRTYYLPGERIGEAQVLSVEPNRSRVKLPPEITSPEGIALRVR